MPPEEGLATKKIVPHACLLWGRPMHLHRRAVPSRRPPRTSLRPRTKAFPSEGEQFKI